MSRRIDPKYLSNRILKGKVSYIYWFHTSKRSHLTKIIITCLILLIPVFIGLFLNIRSGSEMILPVGYIMMVFAFFMFGILTSRRKLVISEDGLFLTIKRWKLFNLRFINKKDIKSIFKQKYLPRYLRGTKGFFTMAMYRLSVEEYTEIVGLEYVYIETKDGEVHYLCSADEVSSVYRQLKEKWGGNVINNIKVEVNLIEKIRIPPTISSTTL